jgi:hypothetical protein
VRCHREDAHIATTVVEDASLCMQLNEAEPAEQIARTRGAAEAKAQGATQAHVDKAGGHLKGSMQVA